MVSSEKFLINYYVGKKSRIVLSLTTNRDESSNELKLEYLLLVKLLKD